MACLIAAELPNEVIRHTNMNTSSSKPLRPMLAEPTTSLTDLALAVLATFYAIRLCKRTTRGERSSLLWALALAAAGLAALAGAVSHGIREDSSLPWLLKLRAAAWKIVGLSTATASGFMLAGSIIADVSPRRRKPLLAAAAVKTAVFAAAGWKSGNFLFTILDYGSAMLVILVLQLRNFGTSLAAPWLTAGIIVSFAAAAVQRSGFALHARFNHNDLYHVIQMGAFHLLYEGAQRMQDGGDLKTD